MFITKTLNTVAAVGFILACCCSETVNPESDDTTNYYSGDAFVPEVTVKGDASEPPFVVELEQRDAGNDSEDSATSSDSIDDGPDASEESPDASEESPDASEESPDAADAAEESPDAAEESPDASEESPDASEESPDASEESPDSGDCNAVGRWRVYINPQMICFRINRPEGFFVDVSSALCTQDIAVELDIIDPDELYGHFVGTIVYHLSFVGESLTANADIDGTITTTAGFMVCDTTAFVTGVKQ